MSPDDPRHGTPLQPASERVAGCPCDRCEVTRRLWRRNRKLKILGRPRLRPAAPVADHIRTLIARDWSAAEIARIADVSPSTISELLSGKAQSIRSTTADRLLGVRGPRRNWSVDAAPSIRRLQALAAIGWPIRQVCQRAGLHERYGALVMGKDRQRVTAAAAEAIAAVYDELSMVLPPQTGVSRHCRAVARNSGWAPPLAWDDIDNDPEPNFGGQDHDVDPVVVMRLLEGQRVKATVAEKEAAMERWVLDGCGSRNELARLHGWGKPERYTTRLRLVRGEAS